MPSVPEFGKRQPRLPGNAPRPDGVDNGGGQSGFIATLKLAAAGFAIAALAVGGWTLLPGPERLAPLLSAFGGSGNGLDFSGDRLGRAATAPLLKVCVDMEPYLTGSGNELEPADILKVLEAGNLQDRGMRLLGHRPNRTAELSQALTWAGVADCAYQQKSERLCDIDNRALAIEAGSSFVRQADRIIAASSAPAAEVQSLRATRDRVLDALRGHLRNGVLVAADFSSFAPAAVRDALRDTEPARNVCARP